MLIAFGIPMRASCSLPTYVVTMKFGGRPAHSYLRTLLAALHQDDSAL
jgi:hypothetical protein